MHYPVMRTHADIIRAAGAGAIHERLGLSINTVRAWAQRDSIPAEHWKSFVEFGFASADELIDAAATRSSIDPPDSSTHDAAA